MTPRSCSSTIRSSCAARRSRWVLRAKRSLVVLGAMIIALASGVMPPSIAALGAAFLMVLLGILAPQQAYRAVAWTTVVLIAAMIPLTTAMQTTGAADQLASALVDVVGGAGPHVLLLGLFVLTAVPRPDHQQLRHGADRDPDRGLGRGRARRLRPAAADDRRRGCRGFVFDAGGDPREPDGDGARGLPLRRLLEARPAAARLVRRVAVLLVPVFWSF